MGEWHLRICYSPTAGKQRIVAEFTGITVMPGLLAPRHVAPCPDPLRDALTALAFYERGELHEAGQRLTDILPEARRIVAADALVISHVLLARLALMRGERESWLRHLIELERFGQQSGCAQAQCAAWLERTRVATLNNQLDVAQVALQTSLTISDRRFCGLATGEFDIPLIASQRLRIAQGNYNAAVDDLLLALHTPQQNRPREIRLQLLLAMAQGGLKQNRLAMQTLDRAMRLAGDVGFWQCFIDEGEPLAALLRRWDEQRCAHADRGIDPAFVTQVLGRLGIPPITLTPRETQVLHLLAAGHRNRTIAQKLFLGECTVKSHLHKINVKLGAHSRTQALAIARTRGWLD